MASKRLFKTLTSFTIPLRKPCDTLRQCPASPFCRTMATEAQLPDSLSEGESVFAFNYDDTSSIPAQEVLTTIYSFPHMEPLRFKSYASKLLHLPLRRDLLHRAIVYEGDGTRQGSASSKTRFEVHGSHRKIRPQKGTGNARLGTAQSPLLKGGGKSFGPHPRDFSTDLPRKMYDIAWRTALSYRYRRGQLIICEDGMDVEIPEEGYTREIFTEYGWGKPNGRSTLITSDFRENLSTSLENSSSGRALIMGDVDVKDLLETGRIIIEESALDSILRKHQSDLSRSVKKGW